MPRSRLTEPSSAAGVAVADQAPAIVELGLTAVAAIAGIAAIVRCEGAGS